jgi:hypothetical protein
MPASPDTGIPPSVNPAKVSTIMVCEALPDNPEVYFYSSNDSFYVNNAFNLAGG